MKGKARPAPIKTPLRRSEYRSILGSVAELIEAARGAAARSINALMTATYWAIGQRIVEAEQQGRARARYGEALIERLSEDLSQRYGRGFGPRNLAQMRAFYGAYRNILQTASAKLVAPEDAQKLQTLSAKSSRVLAALAPRFPLPWSHYVKLVALENPLARSFYEADRARWRFHLCRPTATPAGGRCRGESRACTEQAEGG